MPIADFWRDERGAITIWILAWSVLFLGFAGLAVDISNAYRVRSMLQATADASAHAGAVSLAYTKDDAAARGSAVDFAERNLPSAIHGAVVETADVAVGVWDPATRTLDTSAPNPGAVLVRASRSNLSASKSPVPTSLLRVIDFDSWNITVTAVALGGVAECLQTNAVTARHTVEFNSNSTFGGSLCVHGHQGVTGNNNSRVLDGADFMITMNNAKDAIDRTSPSAETGGWGVVGNELDDYYKAAYLIPWDAHPDRVRARIDAARDVIVSVVNAANQAGTPSTTHKAVLTGGHLYSPDNSTNAQFFKDLQAGFRNFYVVCDSKNTKKDPNVLNLNPNANYKDVTIVTNCQVRASQSVSLTNSTIMSYDTSGVPPSQIGDDLDNAAIKLGAKPAQVTNNDCGLNPGATLVAMGDITFTSLADFGDIRIVSANNVAWTANADFRNSVQVLAWGAVSMTSNNVIAPCYRDGTNVIATVDTFKLVD